jgi:hypothetical protein
LLSLRAESNLGRVGHFDRGCRIAALPATTAKAANHPIALAAWIDALAIPVAQLYGQPTARKPLE